MSWKTYLNVLWKGSEKYLERNDGSVSQWNVLYSLENIYQNNTKLKFIYNQSYKNNN